MSDPGPEFRVPPETAVLLDRGREALASDPTAFAPEVYGRWLDAGILAAVRRWLAKDWMSRQVWRRR